MNMKKHVVSFFLSALICVASGCAQLRGYVSRDNGQMSLRVKNQVGQGASLKEYFVTHSQDIINIGDSQKRVEYFLGYPPKKAWSIDGYEIWIYPESKVQFYFVNDAVRAIQEISEPESQE